MYQTQDGSRKMKEEVDDKEDLLIDLLLKETFEESELINVKSKVFLGRGGENGKRTRKKL